MCRELRVKVPACAKFGVVPWTEDAVDAMELLDAIRQKIGIFNSNGAVFDSEEVKPHGRIAYTIQCGGGGYFDISVMPRVIKGD